MELPGKDSFFFYIISTSANNFSIFHARKSIVNVESAVVQPFNQGNHPTTGL
jgi:hypothetical protein